MSPTRLVWHQLGNKGPAVLSAPDVTSSPRRDRITICASVGAIVLSLGGWTSAQSQQAKQLQQTDGCGSCQLVEEELLRARGEEGDLGVASSLMAATRDSRGRYWLSFGPAALVNVVDADGRVVGVVGRRGEGPGESSAPTALVPVGDSVLVFDQVLQRVTVVGPDLVPVRTMPVIGQVFSGVSLGWPRVVINALVPSSDGSGHPYHILDIETGLIERSFGGVSVSRYDPRDYALILGHVALDPNGNEVWTLSRARFLLQKWSLQGELLQSFTADPDWFPRGGRLGLGNRTTPPDARNVALQFSGDSPLVFFEVARPGWRDAWRGRGALEGGHPRPGDLPSAAELRQARVALIDPGAGTAQLWDHDLYPVGLSQPSEGLVVLDGQDQLFPVVTVKRLRVLRR